MGDTILDGYARDSAALIRRFETISSNDLYAPVQHLMPARPSRILDLGAGTGRDAAWFSSLGHWVVAVEPVADFRQAGRDRHPTAKIEWVDDRLPLLEHLLTRNEAFDVVVLNAVWQHLEDAKRQDVFPRLRKLTARNGMVIISIRNGPGADSRPVFPAHVQDAILWAQMQGFDCILQKTAPSIQSVNRAAGVSWTWLAFRTAA